MKVQAPQEVKNIIDKFEEKGFEIYIVGGAIRDLLMGKIVYDWDFTTNACPEDIQSLFEDSYYDNKFGTVGIPAANDEDRPYEITTFRTEHGYSDSRRPDKVIWGKTLEEDLKRRDFTINAMAIKRVKSKSQDYEVIDLYDGQKDIKNKLIRSVGDPNERFSEDPLRMMRAVRIAAEINFTIEKKTLDAMKANSALIHKIAKERVRDELLKILASSNPHEGIELLRETNLSQEILPEFEKTFGVEQKSPGRHHIYDVGTHSMMSLKNCPSTDPITRFSTLIHDIGKPQTYKKLDTGVVTFYNHEMVSSKIAGNIADRLRFSKKQKNKLLILVRHHQFTLNENQTDSAIRRFIKKVGIENIPSMLDLRTGDRLGGGAAETSWRLEEFKKRLVEVQKQPFTVHDLKITGEDVMKELNIKPGPEVGEILQKLYEDVADNKIPNEKKALYNKLQDYK